MNGKHRVIFYLAGILVLCLAFSIAMASGSTPTNPPDVETPTPPEPVITEEAPAPQQGQMDLPPNPPLPAAEAPVTDLPTEEIQPVEQTDPPRFPEQAPTTEEGLQPGQASAPATIEAVVVKSYNGCTSNSLVWDSLNTDWSNYGSIPIHINYNYAGLCGASDTITYAKLAASQADVVIISDPVGANLGYSGAEISAIQQYAAEGHHLVGTYLLFQNSGQGNLAPLFGLQGGLTYIFNPDPITPTYNYLEPANPLFKNLSLAYASSGYN